MRKFLTSAALVAACASVVPAGAQTNIAYVPPPMAVIAHIDAGINPYAAEFRDTSPLAYQHPSTYIPGYPADAIALNISLNEPTWDAAFAKDKTPIWDPLLKACNLNTSAVLPDTSCSGLRGKIFWFPGTKIIAATVFGLGGTYCPVEHDVTPAPWPSNALLGDANKILNPCTDYPILDDLGHGTMTASRMAGTHTSLCPTCRIVSVEGLSPDAVKWVADQGWVDVQTNSWGSYVPSTAIWALDAIGATDNWIGKLEAAAASMPVYFASGNGAAFSFGWATWPSELGFTLVKGAIWVGAHDNGRVAHWSGAPAHVVADGYGGLTASNRAIAGYGPAAITCCTSAASPYAAGEGAAIILRARELLGDHSVGVHGGVIAHGTPQERGPLADGVFTLDEFKALVRNTAEARPLAGEHDGWIHWSGDPRAPDLLPYGPGANVFCEGCWTLPVKWSDVPEGAPAYASIGYGSANERSLALASLVLSGDAPQPSRADVDEFFADEAALRDVFQHPDHYVPIP